MVRNSKAHAVLCKCDLSRSQCYDASLTFDIFVKKDFHKWIFSCPLNFKEHC